jgi:hypothetical protein
MSLDDIYVGLGTVLTCPGTRWLAHKQTIIDIVVKGLYLFLTFGRGSQTLGEEYTDILPFARSRRRTPGHIVSFPSRTQGNEGLTSEASISHHHPPARPITGDFAEPTTIISEWRGRRSDGVWSTRCICASQDRDHQLLALSPWTGSSRAASGCVSSPRQVLRVCQAVNGDVLCELARDLACKRFREASEVC